MYKTNEKILNKREIFGSFEALVCCFMGDIFH